MRNDALTGAAFELAHAHISWPDGKESHGWGRDADLDLAGLKAVAESVERYASERLPAGASEAAAANLPAWMDPRELVRYEEAQYAAPAFPLARFATDQVRWWVPAQSFDGGQKIFVLADFVCMPRAFDTAYRSRLTTYATSSGCATGSTLQEAMERALLELVERDAFMRHWFGQVPGAAVPQESLPEWAARRLRALQETGCRAGIQWLKLGVQPVVLAWARHEQLAFTCLGSACGFDAEAVLANALGELETLALARADGLPEQHIEPKDVKSPADHGELYATRAHFADADALLMRESPPCTRSFREFAAALPRGIDGLHACMGERGQRAWWVDLSVPEAVGLVQGLPLYTVRALAPGMIPIAFGHGLQPLGMAEHIAPGGRRLHPFS